MVNLTGVRRKYVSLPREALRHESQGFSRRHSRRTQAGCGRKSYEAEGLNGNEGEQAWFREMQQVRKQETP